MSDQDTPDVDDIKQRLKVEIPIEEEDMPAKAATENVDVTEELRRLGRQVGETMRTAWSSKERQDIEAEVRSGVNAFVSEVDKVVGSLREGKGAERVRDEVQQMRQTIEEKEVAHKTRTGLSQGLRWLSDGLSKLAERINLDEDVVVGQSSDVEPDGDA